jgi:hypothetical protein
VCIQNNAAKLEFILGDNPSDGKPSVSVMATATYTTHSEIASVFSWMCASFRCSPNTEVMISSAVFDVSTYSSTTSSTKLSIRPDVLHSPSTVSCWHSIFPNRVVSYGFPVRARQEGVGLAISFEHMIAASRCLSLLEYDSGLIAHGLTSILIPMAELKKEDSIQWHLESKLKQKIHKLARISQVLSSLPDPHMWLKGLQPEKLMQRRCFLGLAEHANVIIGTKDYQRSFGWSGSSKVPTEACVKTHSLTLGSGFMGTFGGNSTFTRTSEALRSTICSPQEKDIIDILDSGKEHYALLFDTAQNIGWYLPQISIALQIIHTIIYKNGYQVYDDSNGDFKLSGSNTLGFANAGPDAAVEASNAVKRSLQVKIRKYNSDSSGPVDMSFAELFTKVWHTLNNAETGLEESESDFRKAGQTAPTFIHGVEFLDAANLESSIRIKFVKVNQPWAHLTSEQPLVMLSKNIQHPIVPDGSGLCKSWQSVPSKASYLVSTGIAISSFLDRRNEGLAERLDWNIRKELIESHMPTSMPVKQVPVNHVQRLVSRKKLRSNSPIRKMIHKCRNGCFVFGPDTDTHCREPIISAREHSERSTYATAVEPKRATPSDPVSDTNLISTAENEPEENDHPASISSFQLTAIIRPKDETSESENLLYVVNGSTQTTGLNSQPLSGNESALNKRTPRFKGKITLRKWFSSTQDKGDSNKSLEQTAPEACRNGLANPSQHDDFYDA